MCVCVRMHIRYTYMCVYDVMYICAYVYNIYRIYTVNIEQDDKPINILNYVTSLRIEVEGISPQITITDHLFAWFREPLLDM